MYANRYIDENTFLVVQYYNGGSRILQPDQHDYLTWVAAGNKPTIEAEGRFLSVINGKLVVDPNKDSIIAIFVSIFGLMFQYFAWVLSMKRDMSTLSERIAVQETKMEHFWNAIGSSVTSMIKQPVHFRKDELMDKLQMEMQGEYGAIKEIELLELRSILEDEIDELRQLKDPKVIAYALALAYISQKLITRNTNILNTLWRGERT